MNWGSIFVIFFEMVQAKFSLKLSKLPGWLKCMKKCCHIKLHTFRLFLFILYIITICQGLLTRDENRCEYLASVYKWMASNTCKGQCFVCVLRVYNFIEQKKRNAEREREFQNWTISAQNHNILNVWNRIGSEFFQGVI